MADDDETQAEVAHQGPEQVEHLGLHHHVERGRRLVGDHQARLQASAIAIMTRCFWPPES